MKRGSAANGAHHLHARTFAVGAFNVNNFIALAHAQIDRLLYQLVQIAHGRQCSVAHIQSRFDHVAQFKQTHAEAVAARFGAIDKSTNGEIVQNAVRCGRVQSRFFADLF